MKNKILSFGLLGLSVMCMMLSSCQSQERMKGDHTDATLSDKQSTQTPKKYAMVIHGGAGTILKSEMPAELEKEYTEILNAALELGRGILAKGGKSIDAVEQVIHLMENSPLFNAGKGAVFTHAGRNEMDASIMHGSTNQAGAVAGVSTVKNPISLARAVMEKSAHVMLSGAGAEEFAAAQGLEIVKPAYFFTQRRKDALNRAILREKDSNKEVTRLSEDRKRGTVGVVALDSEGNLVAGTSTGGMTNKKYGRIGDSPIIGAGTFANSQVCGISCTGHGEYFIRQVVAYDIYALMAYKGLSIAEAAHEVVNKKLLEAGGEGGIIGLDKYGNPALIYNTDGMYRGYINPDTSYVGIYK